MTEKIPQPMVGPCIGTLDRLITRIVVAVQAEKKLDKVPIDYLWKLLDNSRLEETKDLLPDSYEELYARLEKLDNHYYISLEKEPPTASIGFRGVMVCGAMPIPLELGKRLKETLESISIEPQ